MEASPSSGDTLLGEVQVWLIVPSLLAAESGTAIFLGLQSALRSTQKLYRKSNYSLPSTSTSNFTESLMDYYQKDWPNDQIPGSWEILTFGFVLIWNETSYFEITHKREVYRGKKK